MNEDQRPEGEMSDENGRRRKERIEAEIAATRARISNEVSAIGEKFTPEHMRSEARRYAADAAYRARRRVRRAGASFPETVRSSPLPLALIGLGVGWLVVNAWRRSGTAYVERDAYGRYMHEEPYGYAGEAEYPGYPEYEEPGMASRAGQAASRAYHRVGEAGSNVAHRVGEAGSEAAHRVSEAGSHAWERTRHAGEIVRDRAQRVGHEARMRAEQARVTFDNTLEDNPLAVGAVALGVGAAVGLLLPSSSAEDRWFGEQRDKLLDQARGKASEVGEAAREAMHKAREAAEEEAQKRGLLPGQAAAGARDILSQSAAVGRETFEKKIERPS